MSQYMSGCYCGKDLFCCDDERLPNLIWFRVIVKQLEAKARSFRSSGTALDWPFHRQQLQSFVGIPDHVVSGLAWELDRHGFERGRLQHVEHDAIPYALHTTKRITFGLVPVAGVGTDDVRQRGRRDGLLYPATSLQRHATAAVWRLHHPRLDGRLLDEDTLLLSEGADRIARGSQWLQAIMRHVARLQRGLMDKVALAFRPFFQIIDGILDGGYLPNQVLLFLQIDRSIEKLPDHFYLTDLVVDQQGKRCGQRRFSIWEVISILSRGPSSEEDRQWRKPRTWPVGVALVSLPKYSGRLRSSYERSPSLVAATRPIHCLHAELSCFRKGVVSRRRPARHQTCNSLSGVAHRMEMVGAFDHQFYRLVPKIIGHVVSSGILSDGLTRPKTNRSSDLVPGSERTLEVMK